MGALTCTQMELALPSICTGCHSQCVLEAPSCGRPIYCPIKLLQMRPPIDARTAENSPNERFVGSSTIELLTTDDLQITVLHCTILNGYIPITQLLHSYCTRVYNMHLHREMQYFSRIRIRILNFHTKYEECPSRSKLAQGSATSSNSTCIFTHPKL